jgi:DNA-directed RNA polymerase subunit RPC12/RpoP
MQVTSNVKCYFCGHVSGQLVAERDHPERGKFQPRAGYMGDPNFAGKRIRCERCSGPVFLEEVLPMEIPFSYRTSRTGRRAVRTKLSGAA